MNHLIEFHDVIAFTKCCAELLRQGLTFRAHEHTNGEFHIILLGGY
jgi:hypothetical protein